MNQLDQHHQMMQNMANEYRYLSAMQQGVRAGDASPYAGLQQANRNMHLVPPEYGPFRPHLVLPDFENEEDPMRRDWPVGKEAEEMQREIEKAAAVLWWTVAALALYPLAWFVVTVIKLLGWALRG